MKVIGDLKDLKIKTIFNPDYAIYDQIRSLNFASPHISDDGTLLLMDGDLILPSEGIKQLIDSPFCSLLIHKTLPTVEDMGAVVEGKHVKKLEYGKGQGIWMSISKTKGNCLKRLLKLAEDYKNYPRHSTILNRLISEGFAFHTTTTDKPWANVNDIHIYEALAKNNRSGRGSIENVID